jgi:hypothetical protein
MEAFEKFEGGLSFFASPRVRGEAGMRAESADSG